MSILTFVLKTLKTFYNVLMQSCWEQLFFHILSPLPCAYPISYLKSISKINYHWIYYLWDGKIGLNGQFFYFFGQRIWFVLMIEKPCFENSCGFFLEIIFGLIGLQGLFKLFVRKVLMRFVIFSYFKFINWFFNKLIWILFYFCFCIVFLNF